MRFNCSFWPSLSLVLRIINNFFVEFVLLLRVGLVGVSVGKVIVWLSFLLSITIIQHCGASILLLTVVFQKVGLTKQIPIGVRTDLLRFSEIFRANLTLETMSMEK